MKPLDPNEFNGVNADAERGLLGGVMISPKLLPDVLESVPDAPNVFCELRNQTIWDVIVGLYRDGKGIDPTLVGSILSDQGRYEAVGGAPYLATLEESVVSTFYVMDYARIVAEKWERRRIVKCLEESISSLIAGKTTVEAIQEASSGLSRLLDASTGVRSSGMIGDIAVDFLSKLEIRVQESRHGRPTGLSTGLPKLDYFTLGGLRPAQMIVVAARTSVGKTALALQIAAHAAFDLIKNVMVFSFEMDREEIIERIAAERTGVKYWKLRKGMISNEEMDSVHKFCSWAQGFNLVIDDAERATVDYLRARCESKRLKLGRIDMIVVDYLQLMDGPGKNDNARVSGITRGLKMLARKFECPIIALSQFSREETAARRKNAKPTLSMLRDSGSIEQDADICVFLHAPNEIERSEREIAIKKHRGGRVTQWEPIVFDGELQRFTWDTPPQS